MGVPVLYAEPASLVRPRWAVVQSRDACGLSAEAALRRAAGLEARTDCTRGVGFARMESNKVCEAVIERLNGVTLDGTIKKMKIDNDILRPC